MLLCYGCASTFPYPVDSPSLTQKLPDYLIEISGIEAFGTDSVIAHDDESARLSSWKIGDSASFHRSGSTQTGDFEAMALQGTEVWLLESSGRLFHGPISTGISDSISNFAWRDLAGLPAGMEYEGLAWDPTAKNLLILSRTELPGQPNQFGIFGVSPIGGEAVLLHTLNTESLKVWEITEFHPSGLARHPITEDWYVISAKNPAIAQYSADWELITASPLSKSMLRKPESISFLPDGRMILASEGKKPKKNREAEPAVLLIFSPK